MNREMPSVVRSSEGVTHSRIVGETDIYGAELHIRTELTCPVCNVALHVLN